MTQNMEHQFAHNRLTKPWSKDESGWGTQWISGRQLFPSLAERGREDPCTARVS